jgi:DNA-binding LacI/PurR family transcriptional regulator
MARKVTLKEVAAHAGVSYQTVSKVINRKVRISKEKEERIWQSVRELGYRPNLIARSLRSQRSYMIGFSWEPAPRGLSNSILDQFIQSMATAAESAGYHMLAFPHHPGGAWISGYRELIDTNRVDGFVLYSVEYNDPRVEFLKERNFPFVAFGRSRPGFEFPYVDVDGCAGMRKVIDHLVEQGHRRIGVLAWPQDSRVGQNRMEGICSRLSELGIPLYDEWVAHGEGIVQFGYQVTSAWLDCPPGEHPTAIVCFNDLMAIGALHAAREKGVRVGPELAVTGFDDMPLTQYFYPSLTTVRQPIWDVGQRVMSLLLDLLEEKTSPQTSLLLEPTLVVRQSSQGFCGQSNNPN